jgi:hypothetical protein
MPTQHTHTHARARTCKWNFSFLAALLLDKVFAFFRENFDFGALLSKPNFFFFFLKAGCTAAAVAAAGTAGAVEEGEGTLAPLFSLARLSTSAADANECPCEIYQTRQCTMHTYTIHTHVSTHTRVTIDALCTTHC